MSKIVPGTFRARATGSEFLVTEKGTEFCRVHFEIVGGEFDGEQTAKDCWLTEKTGARTVETLQLCGAEMKDDDITDHTGLGSKEVELVIENETYEGKTRAKVQWVNDPNSTGGRAAAFAPKASKYAGFVRSVTHKPGPKATSPQSDKEKPLF